MTATKGINLRSAFSAFQSIGDKGFLEKKSLLLAAPLALITSVATAPLTSLSEVVIWTMANLGSLGFLALLLIPFWSTRSAGNQRPISAWLVLLFSWALGALKAGLVFGLVVIWTGQPLIPNWDLASRVLAGGLIGLVTLPLLSLAVLALHDLQQIRQLVAARDISGRTEFSSRTQSLIQGLVSTILAQEAVLSAKGDSIVSREELQEFKWLLETKVKPLSKKLWDAQQSSGLRPSARSLIRLSMERPIWITPVLMPIALGSIPVYLGSFDSPEALLILSLLVSSSGLLLLLANRLKNFRARHPVAWFWCAISVASSGPLALVVLATGFSYPRSVLWLFGLASAMAVGALVASVARLVFEESREAQSALKELREQDARADSVIRNEARFRANQLHGQIQSRMVATMLKSQDSNGIERSFLLNELRDIRAALTQNPWVETSTLESIFEDAAQRWNGFLELEVSDPDRLIPYLKQELIGPILEEILLNAYRHGMADMVQITFEKSESGVLVNIRDNGVGLRDGPSGLGSALFAEVDPGWTIQTHSAGGSSLSIKIDIENEV